MKRWMTIDGQKCLIRGQYTPKEVRDRYASFLKKFPDSKLTLLQWAAERGAIYFVKENQR